MEKISLGKEMLASIQKDDKVLAVLLFGSYARQEKYRDIDIAVVLDKKYSDIEMSRYRQKFLAISQGIFDIHVFQQLPVYIRTRILKDGKIIFCKDEQALYEIAFSTIKEFDSFEKLYELYLQKVKNG